MYLSIKLQAIEMRQTPCTRHAAGIAHLVEKTSHIVRGYPLHILTSHGVMALVNSEMFTLSTLRQQRISRVLEAPNIIFTHEGINMADQMTISGEQHDCVRLNSVAQKIRPDLRSDPLPSGVVLYTDGCCFRDLQGQLRSGFAIVEQNGDSFQTVVSGKLDGKQSAQRAEIRALIEACKWGRDDCVEG